MSGMDRTVSFVLRNGVNVYGGFAGTEDQLEQRDWTINVSILSGDLNGDDVGFTNNSENSYHVVSSAGTNNSAVLDGFTIRGGNANNAASFPQNAGGGILNEGTCESHAQRQHNLQLWWRDG
jgi:hypothetical protein